MRFRLAGLAIVFAVLALSAGASAAQFRHLEYAFALYPSAGVSAHAVGRFSGPNSGVLYVDFVRNAPDGGAIVRASAWWWNELRADQPVTCELYPTGGLVCDQYPVAENEHIVLLPLLARDYFAGIIASSTAKNAYKIRLPGNFYSWACTVDLKVLSWSGSVAQIESRGVSRQITGPKGAQLDNATVYYDRSKSLPTLVHDDVIPTQQDSGDFPVSVDLKLLKEQP